MVSQGFSWAVTIIVARLLSPQDYGLMGMASLLIGLIYLFNEMGLGAVIIQRREISKADLDSIFWFSVFFGLILYGVAWMLAPLIAWFFKMERLIPIIRVLSLSLLIAPFRIIPYNLLTRELALDKRSKAELVASFLAGFTSISMALAGAGVWSLVGAILVNGTVLTALLSVFVKWRPGLSVNRKSLISCLSFGGMVSGERMMWYS